ncbi:MAG: hypothetical protein IPQ06_12760 [Chitinophagaceae bacterium]|nr:hypothetical protein [Chitinophagaceae bacterium]
MRKRTVFYLLSVVLVFFLTFTGCQKNTKDDGGNITPPDLISKVNSSVSGFVTNENNLPVLNATVQIGSSTN